MIALTSRSLTLSLSFASLLVACAAAPVAPPVVGHTAFSPRGGALPPIPARLDARVMALALEGRGRWVDAPRYGPAWIPDASRDRSFAPYVTRGRWVASDAGWFWRSDDAWGAVTFHYGRWTQLDGAWAWVPGAAFAPAWVEWRAGGGWIGWSPSAPVGDIERSPFVYVAADALSGEGLSSRAVQGAAAVSLFALTSSPSPVIVATRPIDEVWRASLPGPFDAALSLDGEVVARLSLPDAPSARSDDDAPSISRVVGRSFEVARAAIAPTRRSSSRITEYAPVHMPPPVESWPSPGTFRFGAPLRSASTTTASATAAAPREITAITPSFSGSATPPAAPVQTATLTGGGGLSAPPPSSSGASGSPVMVP